MGWQEVTWRVQELMERIQKGDYTSGVYGIPRGGSIVSGLLPWMPADAPEMAGVIVDDIYDSGATAKRWEEATGKKVLCLVDKRDKRDEDLGWVVFPWEEKDETSDAEDTVIRQLEFIGEDPTREGLRETPKRVLKAMKEMTSGYQANPQEILSKTFSDVCDEMVVVDRIGYWSLCEHHMLPFYGTATVAYLPKDRVVGLSKIPRLVEALSRRLQVQERLTEQIAKTIQQILEPRGVGVLVEGNHLCCAMRGAKTPVSMKTSCLLGEFREPEVRAEFLALRS